VGTTLSILQNDGTGTFKKPVNYSLSGIPSGLVAGDFNHDGHLDLAIANGAGAVSILLGSGNIQFVAQADIRVGEGSLSSIAVGDFNGDGNQDLVVASATQNEVAVLLGQGNGTFAPASLYVVGNSPLGVVAGNFYGSGHIDLATIDVLSRTLSVPAGNGDGTFVAGRAYLAGIEPVAVASGDLDGDGKPDLVVASYCGSDPPCGGSGSVAILLSDANGVYSLSSTYAMGAGSVSVVLLDVNGDKKLDLVALNRVDKTMSIRLGSGNGTFGKLNTTPLSAAPIAVATGDFNQDGNVDLAVLGDCGSNKCTQPGGVTILLGSGDGNFQVASTYAVGYSPAALAVGLIRGGKIPDVVVANRCGQDASCQSGGAASVLLGDGTGAFKPGTDIPLGNSPSSIGLANLRAKSLLDLVVSRSADNTVAVLPGNGDATFGTAVPYKVGTGPGALVIADFNGDGVPDVAVANTGDSTVSVLFGRSDGTLQKPFAVPVSSNATGIAAIAGAKSSSPASLATTNGSTGSAFASSNVTVVTNLNARPALASGPTPTISLTLTAGSSSPSNVNQGVSFTATVRGDGVNPPPTGGVVVFSSDAIAISDCSGATGIAVLQGSGPTQPSTAVCPTSVLTANPAGHAITAQYLGAGDTFYADSAPSTAVTQVVNSLAPTVLIQTTGANPSPVNTTVTFQAGLTGVSLTPTIPSGTMTFDVGGTTVDACTQKISGGDVATCPISNLAVGNNNVHAIYTGDTNFVAAAPGATSFTMTKASPALVLTSSQATPSVNTLLTLTATLTGTFTPIAPTGTIAFSDGVGPIPVCGAQPMTLAGSSYVATCTLSNAAVGPHSYTAAYAGDGNFNGATGDPQAVTIGQATTTTAVSAVPAGTSALNASVTFTAAISGTFTPTAPTGTVNFAVGTGGPSISGCGSQSIFASGLNYVATCTTDALAAGTNTSITAAYSGDTNFAGSTGSIPHTVTALTPVITLTDSPAGTSAVNQSVSFTATLTPLAGDSLTPNVPVGTVAFSANATGIANCASQSVSATAPFTATCTTSNLNAANNIPIVAVFTTGNTNYNNATSASLPHSITPLSGALTLTGPTSTTVGTSVSYTATVTSSSVSPVAPTGNVAFELNGSPIAACTALKVNASHQAVCPTNALVAPTDSIAVTYSGDTNFTPVSSPTPALVSVAKASPIVTLSGNPNPAEVNETVTFIATVPSPAGGSPTIYPTGAVTFTQAGTTLCGPVTLTGTYPMTASCQHAFSSVVAGATITATYSGDTNFSTSQGNLPETVVAATTTITVSSPGSSTINQSVNFTAVITPAYTFTGTTAIPQGTVTFANTTGTPATLCGPVPVNSDGTVPVCSASFSAVGSYGITATFTPTGGNFTGSVSATFTQSVVAGTEGLNLSSSLNPSTVNQQVTLTASFNPAISGTQPTGTVTFTDTFTNKALCSAIPVNTTTPSAGDPTPCVVPMGIVGAHTVEAAYSGDSNFKPVSSTLLTQTVNQTPTTTALNSSSSSSSVNQNVTFTATINPGVSDITVPTGTVTFNSTLNNQTVVLCLAQSVSTTLGVTTASCTAPLFVAGPYSIAATYSGDQNFVQSSASMAQTVTATSTTVTASGPAINPFVNQSVTFTASVVPSFTSSNTTPTGTMTFTDSVAGTQLCAATQVTVSGSGATASCAVVFLVAGQHTITATYSGDPNFVAGTPATVNTTVDGTVTTTILVSSGASPVNQPVTFTTTTTAKFPGKTIPQGTVSLATNANPAPTGTCTSALTVANDGTVPSCTFTFSAAGAFNVTATFTPSNSNFVTSASTTISQTVGAASTAISLLSPQPVSSVDQPVTFTASFSPAIIGTQPQGNMTYADGTNTLCTVPVAAGVIQNCVTSFATAGPHSISGSFTSSDKNFNTAPSNSLIQTVSPAASTTIVSSSLPSSSVNQPVTFTATVTPAYPGAQTSIGTVTFNSTPTGGQTSVLCQSVAVSNVNTAGVVTFRATCSSQSPAAGTYTIAAAFSGDANFAAGGPASMTQTVTAPNSVMAITGSPATSSVNQPVTVTVVLTPSSLGSTAPSGTVAFSDSDSATQVCAPATLTNGPISGTAKATCVITFLNAGSHTVSAAYSGDLNFTKAFGNAASPLVVSQTSTNLVITPSSNPSIATTAVSFNAAVTPAITGAAVPTGTITFTSVDGSLNSCRLLPVAAAGGKATATCNVAFPHTTSFTNGQIGVSATYSGDSNFSANSNDPSFSQTVQDFNVAFSVVPNTNTTKSNISSSNGVFITQGFSNTSELFNPAAVKVAVTSSGAYNGLLNVACSVKNSTGSVVSDPSCAVSTATLSGANGKALTYTISATANATVGSYTVYLSAIDSVVTTLSQVTPPLNIYVVGASASLNMAKGATATDIAEFETATAASGTTLTIFTCPQIWDTVKMQMLSNANNSQLTCSGPSGGAAITGGQTAISITITAASSATAQVQRSSSAYLAGLIGFPLLALFGWFGSSKSSRKSLYWTLSLILLA
jgi:hypothetical protein